MNTRARQRAEKIAREELTPRQQDVLLRLLRGETTATIAGNLKLSEYTVSNHLRAIFAAFGVHSRAKVIAPFIVPPDLSGGDE